MSRTASAAALSAATGVRSIMVLLAQLDYDSGAVRANTSDRSIFFSPDEICTGRNGGNREAFCLVPRMIASGISRPLCNFPF